MRFGIRKTSLIDFPGRVSVVLFTEGCDFRCPYCHNPELVVPRRDSGDDGDDGGSDTSDDGLVSEGEVFRFLEARRGLASGVVLSGGEPLAHERIPAIAARIRELGYAVKLDTNGSFPERIAAVGADFVAMDIKTSPSRYGELWPGAPTDASCVIERAIEAVRASGDEYEFRLTCVPGFLGEADAEAIASFLRAEDEVVLQRFRPDVVLDPDWAAGVSPYEEAALQRILSIVRMAAPRARLRGL